MAAPLPLAAGLNGLEGLLPFLFLLVWIISQVRSLFRGADQGRPAGPAAPRPAIDDERHRELARQIDEIIRRAAGEPTDQPRAPAPPTRIPRGPPPLPGGRKPSRPARDARIPRAGAAPAPGEQPRALGSLGGHVADVSKHVDEAFRHEIAHLPAGISAEASAAPGAPIAEPTAGLAALLGNPTTLRQLILAREVLDRPVGRW